MLLPNIYIYIAFGKGKFFTCSCNKIDKPKNERKKKEKGNEGHWNTGARLKRRREQKEEE